MVAYSILAVFILMIALFIYFEYKNEKEYQENRRKKTEERKKTKPPHNIKEQIKKQVVEPKKVPSAKELKYAEEKKIEEQRLKEQKPELEVIHEQKVTEKIDLPECNYPKFNYSRLLKMGLSEDEALEFVKELIPQIKTQIPLIKEAIEASDFNNVERLTHSIKGSSTTVGSGGVSDLLVEFNTYVKTKKEIPILKAYLKYLNHYSKELEKEYA